MIIFYGPGDWLGSRFNARQRRAAATWLLILVTFVLIPATYPWKSAVWMVWALSQLALVLAMGGWIAAETPVEEENG